MNVHDASVPEFEDHLEATLRTRASTLVVRPDLEAVTAATAPRPLENSTHSRFWWLATAVIVVAGGVGFGRLVTQPDGTVSAGGAPTAEEIELPADQADTTALLVWVESDATAAEVEALAGALDRSAAVLTLSAVDRDGRRVAFADFFAGHGDDVELVDPAHVPGALLVNTDNPGDVGDLVTGLPALDGVENTE